MNANETTPPPAPDPFEQIAQQLATLAAGMVQLAGQIAALKPGATPPPPAPQQDEPAPEPAPEPEKEPEAEEQPEQPEEEKPEQDKASYEQPTHEDGQGGEKDAPQDEPEATPDAPEAQDEGEAITNAKDDGKGTAAAKIPDDLPPLDSTLANCSPPPAPSAVPYRPLSNAARKVADILTGALGKRFSLPRSDRHTGTLSSDAVARHAADVFKRRPKRDGRRPRLTVIVDTSGSMSDVHAWHGGSALIDGLLEANRRRVIDLRLFDSYNARLAGDGYICPASRGLLNNGEFSEVALKDFIKANARKAADHGAGASQSLGADCTYKAVIEEVGALPACYGSEGFVRAIPKLKPIIRESDATIIFTDGHWTDGALDKVAYQCEGLQIVGLYIAPEFAPIREALAKLDEAAAADPAKAPAIDTLRAAYANYATAANNRQVAEKAISLACLRGKASGEEYDELVRHYNKTAEVSTEAVRKATKLELEIGLRGYFEKFRHHTDRLASCRAQLGMNSHRAYCAEGSLDAAQMIAQEIVRQISAQ